MKGTLIVSNKGISFEMEKPWKIKKGKMSYEYKSKTKIIVINNSNYNIDSIALKIPSQKGRIKYICLKSGQKGTYVFNVKNNYFVGEYELIFLLKDGLNQLKKIKNILDGFPLESVNKIQFNNNEIMIQLVFGNVIRLSTNKNT